MSLRELKHRATAKRIEHAALELFLEHGYDAVTVEQIAEAAEVSRATVFRYFGTKEGILFADSPRHFELLCARLRSRPRAGVDRDELTEVLAEVAEQVQGEGDGIRRRSQIVRAQPDLLGTAYAAQAQLRQELHEVFAASDHDADPHIVAGIALGVLLSAVRAWAHDPHVDMGAHVRQKMDELTVYFGQPTST